MKKVNCFMEKTGLPLKGTCQGEDLYDAVIRFLNAAELGVIK
jgi:hypothetical protein